MEYKRLTEQQEIWRPIKGYENTHEVSNLGRVRSIPHLTSNKHQTKGQLLKQESVWTGYKRVHLRAGINSRKFYVHRLVAESFIPNPNNWAYVNHKDDTKDNNAASNLEWCTQQYNLKYGDRRRKVLDKCNASQSPNAEKPVVQLLNGAVINIYPSIHEAARCTGIGFRMISRVCNNIRPHTHGYVFKFQ